MTIFSADFLQSIKNLLLGIFKPPITSKLALQVGGTTMNAIELLVGQSVVVTITPVKADGTPSGGKLSNQLVKFNDDTVFASITMNADGTATIKGLAVSMGTISGEVHATVIDSDGYEFQDMAMQFTVTVDADPNFANRTSALDLQVTTPA